MSVPLRWSVVHRDIELVTSQLYDVYEVNHVPVHYKNVKIQNQTRTGVLGFSVETPPGS